MAQTFAPTEWTYAEIVKFDEDKDGSVKVYGRPTHEVLDVDQQIADKKWVKEALPEWMNSYANIREMHQAKAVGKGERLDFDENDDPWLTARIVEPGAVKLVKEGVLKGFSIGIKDPVVKHDKDAKNGRIVGGKIVEVSVVDRPAVPTAKVELVKMVGANEYLDMQTGFAIKMQRHALDGDQLNPADFDEAGNPILQPGHVREADGEPVIISEDAHSVTVKVGDKIYQVPIDVDSVGDIIVGDAELVPGTQPTDGTPMMGDEEVEDDTFEKMGVDSGMQPYDLGVDDEDGKKVKSVSDDLAKAVWSTEYQDSLPDSCFAYISPGGKKKDGKTEPLSLRHLPYKDKDGKPDAAHVRDALARLDQTDIPAEAKAEAKRKLEAAAKEVGVDVEDKKDKGVMADSVKAAATKAAQGGKVLCQTCHKTQSVEQVYDVTLMEGGARVVGKGTCGHPVAKFVKAAEMDADDKKAESPDEDDKAAQKAAEESTEDVEKSTKADDPDKEKPDDENKETEDEDDPAIEKLANVLLKKLSKQLRLKEADADDKKADDEDAKDEEKCGEMEKAAKALSETVAKYRKSIEARKANKAANPNGGPSRVEFDDPKEVIEELKSHANRLKDLIEEGEDQMEHDKETTEGHLGEDPVAPAKKPKGDGEINFTEGDMKSVIADVVKGVMATQKSPSIDLGKAVGDAITSAFDPMIKRLEKVEHMAQPSPFLIAAEKSFSMNPQEDETRADAIKQVRSEMSKLSPKAQQSVLASAIAADRGWA